MKKILSLLLVLSISLFSFAEDVISIKPFTATAGETMAVINAEMVNVRTDFSAFQYDIYVPNGLTITRVGVTERCQAYDDWGEIEKHNCGYNQLESDKPGFNKYRILVYSAHNFSISGKSGAVLGMGYDLSSDIQPGVYPIYINNIVIATASDADGVGGNSNDVRIAETTTYFKVNSPTISKEFPIEFKGFVPSFVFGELKNDVTTATTSINLLEVTNLGGVTDASALSGLYKNPNCLVMIEPENIKGSHPELASSIESGNVTNTITGSGLIKKFVLVDGYDYAMPNYYPDNHISVVAGSAIYTRSNIKSKYNTVCLPFNPTSFNGTLYDCNFEDFNKDDATGVIKLEPTPILNREVPYVFTTEDSEAVFSSENSCVVTTNGAGSCNFANVFYVHGTFEKINIDDPSSFYLKNDKVYHVNEYFTLNAFRAYFRAAGISAKAMSFVIDGDDATGIESVGVNDIDGKEVFDLSGRKISGIPAKGIYIVNGKKTWIK